MQEHVADESRGPYFPFDRRESYPKRLRVDFRRLPRKTLLTYTAHHELHVRPDITHEELAIAAARHFAAWRVNEEAIMRSFCAGLAASNLGNGRGIGDGEVNADRKRKHSMDSSLDVVPPSPENRGSTASAVASNSPRRQKTNDGLARGRGGYITHGGGSGRRGGGSGQGGGVHSPPHLRIADQAAKFKPSRSSPRAAAAILINAVGGGNRGGPEFETGEQVAAYVVRDDQHPGVPPRAWILARVVRNLGADGVELHDEDDPSHIFDLPISDVSHLHDFSSELRKNDKVLAVFPDTTMFYCATIAKDTPRMEGNTKVILVYFEDDEDANGKTRHRRVPVEHIIFEKDVRIAAVGHRGGGAAGGGGPHRMSGSGARRGNQGINGDNYYGNERISTNNSPSNAGAGGAGGIGGGARSRTTSPRARGEYGGGGTAGGHQGGGALLASPVSGGGSAGGGSGGRSGGREGKKAGMTYADMIAHALGRVSGGKGAFTQICNIIESEFSDVLNWKLESDVRKTPVWKSSVRKILFSNNRFAHCSTTPEHGHVFTMARTKK